jgi:hypothetical protein
MHNRITTLTIAALLVCLGFAIPAQTQGPCTLDTITGTYALYERGSSAIFTQASQTYPFHWAGAFAPFVGVGEVTFGPDGIGKGFYWIRIGSFNGGPDPIPVETTITEMNEDCTGKWQFEFNLMGSPTTIEERFILFDNGRQFRSIPTSTGIPTMVWIGEGHRLSRAADPVNTCGPQTSNGTYLLTVENLVNFPTTPIFSDALLLRLDISMNGDYTGMLYEKFGPTGGIELPVWGTMMVNPDCSYASDLQFTLNGVLKTAPMRGVFFDQGKKLYGLNVNRRAVGAQYSFGEGQRIGQ